MGQSLHGKSADCGSTHGDNGSQEAELHLAKRKHGCKHPQAWRRPSWRSREQCRKRVVVAACDRAGKDKRGAFRVSPPSRGRPCHPDELLDNSEHDNKSPTSRSGGTPALHHHLEPPAAHHLPLDDPLLVHLVVDQHGVATFKHPPANHAGQQFYGRKGGRAHKYKFYRSHPKKKLTTCLQDESSNPEQVNKNVLRCRSYRNRKKNLLANQEEEVQLLETFNHTLRSKHDYLDSSIKRLQSYYLDMIRHNKYKCCGQNEKKSSSNE